MQFKFIYSLELVMKTYKNHKTVKLDNYCETIPPWQGIR